MASGNMEHALYGGYKRIKGSNCLQVSLSRLKLSERWIGQLRHGGVEAVADIMEL